MVIFKQRSGIDLVKIRAFLAPRCKNGKMPETRTGLKKGQFSGPKIGHFMTGLGDPGRPRGREKNSRSQICRKSRQTARPDLLSDPSPPRRPRIDIFVDPRTGVLAAPEGPPTAI